MPRPKPPPPVPDDPALASLAPFARAWFTQRFAHSTLAQQLAWPAIAAGEHALLVAPTGSGKTLAAFLAPLGRLAQAAAAHGVPDPRDGLRTPGAGVRVLYISPLRALDADIHHNLQDPLAGIAALARAAGTPVAIEHSVRTGDTSPRERRATQKRPPHVLITTPESLFVLLGSPAWREALARVELVILDELHAIADSKRGTHLTLSLERLEALCAPRRVQRVGLTATAEPIERLAALLIGDTANRSVRVLDARASRAIDLGVEVVPRAGEGGGGDPRVHRVAELVARAERSLVFVGSRAQAERWRPALEKELEEQHTLAPDARAVGIHHGALAREVRLSVEHGLREGTLRAVVATSSLELGIDIGAIDQVVQVGSPGGVSRLLQRVGRAGHTPDATSRGVLVSLGGVDLLECAVIARLALERALEPVRVPEGALDVLAQQLIAHASAAGDAGITLDEFWTLARGAWPYRALSRETVLRLVEALASSHLRTPRLEWNGATGEIRAPESARKLARSAGGTITSRGLYRLLDADSRETIGELDEEFVHESKPGDRFSFGLGVFRIVSIRPDAVLVRRAPPGSARMPFWRGDRPMRAAATGLKMGEVVRAIEPDAGGGDGGDSVEAHGDGVEHRADGSETHTHEPGGHADSPEGHADTPSGHSNIAPRLQRHALGPLQDSPQAATTRPRATPTYPLGNNDTPSDHSDSLQRDYATRIAAMLPMRGLAAAALAEVLSTQARAAPLPTDTRVVVESFADQLGEARIAIHCWLGRSVLEPWAMALSARLEARLGGAVHAVATDNGVLIAPPKGPALDPAGVPRMVLRHEVRALIESLLPRSAIAGAAFREAAERSLLLPRLPFKKRTPLWMSRQRARDLLLAIGDDPTHPMVLEATRDVMNDRWDTRALEALLDGIESGRVAVEHVARRTPSLFARALETAFKFEHLYEDDTPAGERMANRASGSGDQAGTFDSPSDLPGIAERADRGSLAGLAPDLPLMLILARAGGPVRVSDLARHTGRSDDALRAALAEPAARGEVAVGRFTERDAGDVELEVCDTEVLARLRRRALSRARRTVEPVPRRAYQRWLLERHAVGPFAGEGEEAVRAAIERLAMYPMPPEVLERDLLRARTLRYDTAALDLLCARGEVRYVLLENPARIVVAPSSRTEPFPPASGHAQGALAEGIRAVLRERGALFFADVALATNAPVVDASEALARMLRSGEVTNDAFAPARTLATGAHGKGMPAGRYALRAAVPSEPGIEALIERLFARYGVVARALVEWEELAPAWGAMRDELDRREARGEVRRGTVIEGLGPVQFARTETIEALRAARSDVSHAAVLLSARDPALVADVAGLGRASTTRVVIRDGEAIAVVERDGAVVRTLRDPSEHDARAVVEAIRALARLPAPLRPFRALGVERVDERAASDSVLTAALREQGFERDGEKMVLASFRG